MLMVGCNRIENSFTNEEGIDIMSFDIAEFNLEKNLESIQRLIEGTIDIGHILATEEIRRFRQIVILRIINEENRVYRVQMLVVGEEEYFIWDIEDDANEYIYTAYEESFNIIQKASGFSDSMARAMMITLRDFLGVTSVVRAEFRDDESVLEFECAKNQVYLLDMSQGGIGTIRFAETGEIVFATIR